MGVDMHMVVMPPAPPIMLPIPFAGYLIDPSDYGSCKVRLNGFPPARAGTPGIACPPHIPPGGMFVKPPTNECEMHQGSSVVVFAGEAAAAQGNPVLTCHDVGMPAPVRGWRKSPAKSLMMAAANVLPIPGATAVMIGGAPTITMSASASETERESDSELVSIELEVFDPFGETFANARFELHLPNGDVEEGTLDGNGYVEVTEIPKGYALLVLPDLEDDTYRPTPPAIETASSVSGEDGPVGAASGADVTHRVAPGETLRRIALRYGIGDWRALYEHASNEALRRARPNPNVLLSGDVVNVTLPTTPAPIYRRGGVALRAEARHCVLAPQLEHVHLRLELSGTIESAHLHDGDVEREASVESDGVVSGSVGIGTHTATLIVCDDEKTTHRVVLALGHLDPDSSESGTRQRLENLGFPAKGALLENAKKSYKASIGADPEAPFDDDDLRSLLDAHGA